MGKMAKLFLIIVVLLQCFCGLVSQTYRNSNAGLKAVPTDIPDGTRRIELYSNDIRIINDSSFSFVDVSEVTDLYLFNNKIENISKGAFAGFTSLESLYLSNNQLSALELNCNDLPNLNTLDLKHNLLTAVPGFYGICSSLVTLSLSYNEIDKTTANDFEKITYIRSITLTSNKLENFQSFHGSDISMSGTSVFVSYNELTVIHARTFDGFDNLNRIHIHYNKIRYFSITSSDVPRLVEIHLYKNEIEDFPKFYGMMNALKTLTLSHNQISYISLESFENITNLVTLDLSDNQLMEIEINVALPDLLSFDLENNRLSSMPRIVAHDTTTPLKLILKQNRLTPAAVKEFKANSNISSKAILELDLAGNLDLSNNLSQIMNYLFTNFPRMEYLGLSSMRLTEIPNAQYDGSGR